MSHRMCHYPAHVQFAECMLYGSVKAKVNVLKMEFCKCCSECSTEMRQTSLMFNSQNKRQTRAEDKFYVTATLKGSNM